MMYVLFAPAQLQRQAPQWGTAARPRQSLYQPTGRLRPSRGMTTVLARTTGAAGAGLAAGAAGARATAAAGADAGAGVATTTGGGSAAARARCWSRATCRTSRRAAAWASAGRLRWAAACMTGAGCAVSSGKLSNQRATPPRRGARQRRTSPAMGQATRARRQGLRRLHDRHGLATIGAGEGHLPIL